MESRDQPTMPELRPEAGHGADPADDRISSETVDEHLAEDIGEPGGNLPGTEPHRRLPGIGALPID